MEWAPYICISTKRTCTCVYIYKTEKFNAEGEASKECLQGRPLLSTTAWKQGNGKVKTSEMGEGWRVSGAKFAGNSGIKELLSKCHSLWFQSCWVQKWSYRDREDGQPEEDGGKDHRNSRGREFRGHRDMTDRLAQHWNDGGQPRSVVKRAWALGCPWVTTIDQEQLGREEMVKLEVQASEQVATWKQEGKSIRKKRQSIQATTWP